jgi:uncharacterized repeat protein (TIGR03803 family)
LNGWESVFAVFLVCVATAMASPAQTFTTLANFDGANGDFPFYMSLVQGTDGNLYGTTFLGGVNTNSMCNFSGTEHTCGEIFRITPSGALTTLYSFCLLANCADGSNPAAGLVAATDGNLYGTTGAGGTSGGGTVFKITLSGTLTRLYSFNGIPDGNDPQAALVEGTDGNFYGTTGEFGASTYGTVFKISPSGTLTTLHSFSGHDGAFPIGALVQGIDGSFYGTTSGRGQGSNGSKYGTIFKIAPGGKFATLHDFAGVPTDGQTPYSALVQAADGNFYGTTPGGGNLNEGIVFAIAPDGTYSVIHNFAGSDGAFPFAGPVLGPDGNFYGSTTEGGGANNAGTLYEITPAGALTTLHIFDVLDREPLYHGLAQATNGTFYGTTNADGTGSDGTVFSLSVGLAPFVETLPTAGRVGQVVKILGSNLTGATSVTFNGTAAAFTVVSHSYIKTTVPTGATTGTVQVTTPSGTLVSKVAFRVVG